ncbi:MAG TPA: basic amino acid ABC transporter substrate-binding protein [Actinomycetota bacterium]|nr:basic amino acid ABC transporter substrate-binding protein [Actinomycetota bacterium]
MIGRNKALVLLIALLAVFALFTGACGDPDDEVEEPSAGDATGAADPGAGEFTTKNEGRLTVGSDIPYPPFEFRKGGKLTGFDIDIIKEVGTRLGLEVTDDDIKDTSFDTIFSQLAGGAFDVVIAASTITPEREKEVNFSDPYYNAQQSLTVNTNERSDIKSIEDLGEGDVVGVQNGTTGKKYAQENVPEGVQIRSFPEGPDGYTALEAGQVDAVINDEPTAIAEIAERPGLELVQTLETGEAYGIAVDPSNEPLLEAINQALADMIEDGTYEEIYSRYPDLPPGGNVAAG